ncbi:MAG: hypothetical protein PVI07_19730 [Anaerolineae bacterium]|jgi:hypothetical protein
MKRSNQKLNRDPVAYQIKVRGRLDQQWSDWFNGLEVRVERAGDGTSTTTLTGPVADQARLRGIVSKLWDLNLTIISVNRSGSEKTQPHSQSGGEGWEDY